MPSSILEEVRVEILYLEPPCLVAKESDQSDKLARE